tara:strand:- start:916 stop:1452 length:537 start_codon:yes stop_codon:yes gene_type:complete
MGMEDMHKRVEAILFTTGRFLELEELSDLSEIASRGYLKELLNQLKEEYNQRDCSLEIIEDNGKWRLNVRKDYLYLTEKLLSNAELDKPVQQTLAVVAYKQPCVQSEVIDIRGNKAYDHITVLKEQGFVTSEKFGRTRLLKLTGKFYDYFDVVQDKLQSKLKEVGTQTEISGEENAEG